MGKSSFLAKFTNNTFSETFIPTIGVDFRVKTVSDHNKTIKLQIWDTAGEERFRTITSSYYWGASGIILMYSCENRLSFDSLANWIKYVYQHANESISLFLVGNKNDTLNRVVSYDEAHEFANKAGIIFFETSSKTGYNVDTVFSVILSESLLVVKNPTKVVKNPTKVLKILKNGEDTKEVKKKEFEIVKLVLLGDSRTGKTSVLKKYTDDTFSEEFISTIGIDFRINQIIFDNSPIKLQIWDTAGQERFRTITSSHYGSAHAIILLYNCAIRESFDNLDSWRGIISRSGCGKAKVILVGNNCDCLNREVELNEGKEYAKTFGFSFLETSAKTGQNISEIFSVILKDIKNKNSLEIKPL